MAGAKKNTGCPGGGVCRLLVANFWLLIICGCWFRLSPASGGKGKNGHFGEGTLYCMKNRESKIVYWFKLVLNVLWLKLRYTFFDYVGNLIQWFGDVRMRQQKLYLAHWSCHKRTQCRIIG